jgi:hypothetical protein
MSFSRGKYRNSPAEKNWEKSALAPPPFQRRLCRKKNVGVTNLFERSIMICTTYACMRLFQFRKVPGTSFKGKTWNIFRETRSLMCSVLFQTWKSFWPTVEAFDVWHEKGNIGLPLEK